MKIVIFPAVEPQRLTRLQAETPHAIWVNAESEAEALVEMPGTEAFLGKITPALLARADRLRWVQALTASLEHYLFPALVEHPCVLTNARGLFGDVIADQVMGYILCFARNLHIYARHQVRREWGACGGESARVSFAAGPGVVNAMDRATRYLPGSLLGIVGFGGIGAEIARRALAFAMRVRGVDRYPNSVEIPEGVEHVTGLEGLPALLNECDYVVIAAPHTPETERLFDAQLMGLMKPSSILINIGRGAIVVLDDLVAALHDGQIAGAALDVFEVEPLPAEHPLWGMEQVMITPHTAGYSPVIAERHLALLCENVRRFDQGLPVLNQVDKRLWF